MRKLRELSADLSKEGAVKELLATLQDSSPSNISTFEFLSSGAIKQLKNYLQGDS
jgi:hypothetical protein